MFGGSWGSTLALAYAETHPGAVSELVLRGIFLLRQLELTWFYQFGASLLFPEQWQKYLAPIPPAERHDLLGAFHRRLLSDDAAVRLEAARAWSVWEGATSSLLPNPKREDQFGSPEFALALARIEAHYFVNRGFFAHENQLLDGVERDPRRSRPSSCTGATMSFARSTRPSSCTGVGPRPISGSCPTRGIRPTSPASRPSSSRRRIDFGGKHELHEFAAVGQCAARQRRPHRRGRRADSRRAHRAHRYRRRSRRHDDDRSCAASICLPGLIDDQVHCREPGLTHKATLATESLAALCGGVTSFLDMPNTQPPTTDRAALAEKRRIAAATCHVNYGFYLGATNTNLEEIKRVGPADACGVKVFMGASTGNMLVDDPAALEGIFAEARMPIATHCEYSPLIWENEKRYRERYGENVPIEAHPLIRSEEACYRSSSLAVGLAKKHGARLHVLHLTTARELELFERGPIAGKRITAEVCTHHLVVRPIELRDARHEDQVQPRDQDGRRP